MNHSAPPTICAACLAGAHATADMCIPGNLVPVLCDHAGPEAVVIAMASTVGNVIVHWHLEGPMSQLQAGVKGVKIFEQLKAMGMSFRKPERH